MNIRLFIKGNSWKVNWSLCWSSQGFLFRLNNVQNFTKTKKKNTKTNNLTTLSLDCRSFEGLQLKKQAHTLRLDAERYKPYVAAWERQTVPIISELNGSSGNKKIILGSKRYIFQTLRSKMMKKPSWIFNCTEPTSDFMHFLIFYLSSDSPTPAWRETREIKKWSNHNLQSGFSRFTMPEPKWSKQDGAALVQADKRLAGVKMSIQEALQIKKSVFPPLKKVKYPIKI